MPSDDRRAKYDATRTIKKVSFHLERDAELLAYLEGKDFSSFVKELILERKRLEESDKPNTTEKGD